MPNLAARKDRILDYELHFADQLGLAILPKPDVSVWMVLIPLYFVFHMFRHKRYVEGRRVFSANFMTSRRWAADEALEALREERPANLDALCEKAKLPSEEVRCKYREWLAVLTAHYRELLKSVGNDFDGMVKLAYGNRSSYLLVLDRMDGAEKKLNRAMRPHIQNPAGDIDDVVAGIEHHTTRLRQEHARKVFPDSAP